jgi:hypothetical protein
MFLNRIGDYIMARGKSDKLAPFQKLLTVMVTGKPVTIEEIDATLGKEIHMYRLSTYMWHIKVNANGVVKVIKEGRKAVAYQIMNPDEIKKYLNTTGVTKSGFTPGKTTKVTKVAKLADLNATPVVAEAEVASDELEVTEVTQ